MNWNWHDLSVMALASAAVQHEASTPLADLTRLRSSLHPEACAPSDALTNSPPSNNPTSTSLAVHWHVKAEMRDHPAPRTPWLRLGFSTSLPLACQRCLQPVMTPVQGLRWFRFVATEALAMAEDDETSEVDVLSMAEPLDLLALLEDEILLSLPWVPVHSDCSAPLLAHAGGAVGDGVKDTQGGELAMADKRPNPFAVLAKLKKPDQSGS